MDYKSTYSELFSTVEYSRHNETEFRYQLVLEYLKNNNVKKIIDISSGRGVMLDMIKKQYPHIEITSTDLSKFHDVDVKEFREVDLSNKDTLFEVDEKYDLLTCLDVLEHLDDSFIKDVFEWFSKISKKQILTIANHSEIQNGVEIHTIQEDMSYWSPIIEGFLTINEVDHKTFIHMGKPHYLYILKTEETQ